MRSKLLRGTQRMLRLLALVGLMTQVLTGLVSAQRPSDALWPDCGWNCKAEDTYATNFRLRDANDGPLGTC